MAEISETTKVVVKEKKVQLSTRRTTILKEIAQHQASIDSLNAQLANYDKNIAALEADIPEPEVSVGDK